MKMLFVKDKKGRDVELACENIEALISGNGNPVQIVMTSGTVYEVDDNVEHIKHRIGHINAACDV